MAIIKRICMVIVSLCLLSSESSAAMIPSGHDLIPAGLGPGDSFQIIFTTNTKTNAASFGNADPAFATIAYYDNIVNSDADALGFGPSSANPISWTTVANVVDGTLATAHSPQLHDVYDSTGGIFRTLADGVYFTGTPATSPPDASIEVLSGGLSNTSVWTGLSLSDPSNLTRALGAQINVRVGSSNSALGGVAGPTEHLRVLLVMAAFMDFLSH